MGVIKSKNKFKFNQRNEGIAQFFNSVGIWGGAMGRGEEEETELG